MTDKPEKNSRKNDEHNEPSYDYLKRAQEANDSGDFLLSMYLYLAAFQKSNTLGGEPTDAAIFGLKQAWAIACANKERQLAEYIFELMEPYLNAAEIEMCADQLQNLTLDKLEEFGLTREDLEDMAQMITDDIMGDVGPMVRLDGIGKLDGIGIRKVPLETSSGVNAAEAHDDGQTDLAKSQATSDNPSELAVDRRRSPRGLRGRRRRLELRPSSRIRINGRDDVETSA